MLIDDKSMVEPKAMSSEHHYFRQFSAAFALVLVAEFVAQQLLDQLGMSPPLWFMPGIAIAFLWRLGTHLWPALLLASSLGMLVSGMPAAASAVHGLGTAAAALSVVTLLRTLTPRHNTLTLSGQALPFTAAATLGALVFVAFSALRTVWVESDDSALSASTWVTPAAAYVAGALSLGTVFMTYATGAFGSALERFRQPRSLAVVIGILAVGFVLIAQPRFAVTAMLAAIPLMVLLRRRVGLWGALLLLSGLSLILSLVLSSSVQPHAPPDGLVNPVLSFVICLALTLLLSEGREKSLSQQFGSAPDRAGILTLLSEIPSIATIGTDHKGRITFWSAACTAMYGYAPDQVIGRQLDSILKTENRPNQAAGPSPLVVPSAAESQPASECIVETADGARVPVFSSQITLLNSRGESEHYRIDIDLTELRRLERERRSLDARIQDSQRLESLGLMAGGVAHDFNNMLQAIIGNTDLAMMDIDSDSDARRRLRDVLKTSEQAQELCQQMLAFSGRGKFVVRDIDISETIRETTPLLQVSLKQSARLHLELSDELPPVKADSSQIRQLIVNLVANASDALPEDGGDVRVTTYPEILSRPSLRRLDLAESLVPGLYVCFEVADNGSGMDHVTRKQIFDPFFTTKFTGRGLGLAAALGIVRGHSGAIAVESDLGKGSRFRIWLPASANARSVTDAKPAAVEVKSKRPTILVADDEPAVLSSVERILRAADYRVLTATGGASALEIIRTHGQSINLAVIDLTMPSMDGIEVIKEMREFDQRLPVILTSGFTEAELTDHFTLTGPTQFIQKPFRGRNLLDVVESSLAKD